MGSPQLSFLYPRPETYTLERLFVQVQGNRTSFVAPLRYRTETSSYPKNRTTLCKQVQAKPLSPCTTWCHLFLRKKRLSVTHSQVGTSGANASLPNEYAQSVKATSYHTETSSYPKNRTTLCKQVQAKPLSPCTTWCHLFLRKKRLSVTHSQVGTSGANASLPNEYAQPV